MQRCSKALRDALEKRRVTTQITTVRLLKNKVRMCEIQQTKQAKQVWNNVSLLRRYMQLLLSITLLYLACSYVTLEIHSPKCCVMKSSVTFSVLQIANNLINILIAEHLHLHSYLAKPTSLPPSVLECSAAILSRITCLNFL